MTNKKSNFGFGMLIGTILGGITAYFLSSPENRALAKRKIKELKAMWDDQKIQEKLHEIYGEVTEEGKKAYLMAKDEINKRLDEMGIDEVDREKYKSLVEDAVARVRVETKETADQLTKLKDYLLSRWTRISKEEAKKAES